MLLCIKACAKMSPRESHHFRTRFSQSPTTATQMSLTPTSLRRWNQMGKNTKKVAWRSATEETQWNSFSKFPCSVWRWTATFTPQLWSRFISAGWDQDGKVLGSYTGDTAAGCQYSWRPVFWTLFKAIFGFVCMSAGELGGPHISWPFTCDDTDQMRSGHTDWLSPEMWCHRDDTFNANDRVLKDLWLSLISLSIGRNLTDLWFSSDPCHLRNDNCFSSPIVKYRDIQCFDLYGKQKCPVSLFCVFTICYAHVNNAVQYKKERLLM